MAQDSKWLRAPGYGVGALLRGYGFGVPLEDEDADGTKSGKSSGPRYKSKTQQNAELRARQIMQQDAFANQQAGHGNIKGIEGPVQTTDSGEQTGNTILRRALGMDGGNNQPALHIERNAEGVPTRATPNYFMPVDKDNMRAQGLASKWMGAGNVKDRSSIIKEALAIRKDQSNTEKAAVDLEAANKRLIGVEARTEAANVALTKANLGLAQAEADAISADKLRPFKESTAIANNEITLKRLQKVTNEIARNALKERNAAADRLDKQVATEEKAQRKREEAAFDRAQKLIEQDEKDAKEYIIEQAKAAKVMAEVVAKEQASEEKAQKWLFKERMQAYRNLSKADQKLLSNRVFGEGGSARAGFDAAQHIAPGAPTTRSPGFSLKRALSSLGGGALNTQRIPIPEAERERLGPVSDEDWTRMLSEAEMGVIMDSMWRMAVNIANQKGTNAQDEFSRLNLRVANNEMEPWDFIPGRKGQPMDIKPLGEDDLLKVLESGKPLGTEPYKVEGLYFKWDPSIQKFVRVQEQYNQVG